MSVGQFTYQELDDSIFEHIRREVVAQGYYPDLSLYQPTNPTNLLAFNTALDVIKDTKNPINTVGVGAFINKGEVQLNTIYIHRTTTDKGSVSVYDTTPVRTDGLTTPPDASTTYSTISTKGYTQNVEYEIRFVATNQQDADAISNILLLALTMGRDYFSVYDLSTGNVVADKEILLQFVGNQDLDNIRNERIYLPFYGCGLLVSYGWYVA